MERNGTSWIAVIVVAAFSVCGGFVAGSMLGIRERGVLKTKNAALAESEILTRANFEESRNEQVHLTAQMEQAQADINHWRSECERLQSVMDRRNEAVAGFHPPMVLELDPFEAESRIVELECEMAALRELVVGNGGGARIDGPPASNTPMQLTQAAATEPLPAKQQQCSAITKKGARCSRNARSGGKCWQHGG